MLKVLNDPEPYIESEKIRLHVDSFGLSVVFIKTDDFHREINTALNRSDGASIFDNFTHVLFNCFKWSPQTMDSSYSDSIFISFNISSTSFL